MDAAQVAAMDAAQAAYSEDQGLQDMAMNPQGADDLDEKHNNPEGPIRRRKRTHAQVLAEETMVASLVWPWEQPCCRKWHCSNRYSQDHVLTIRNTYLRENEAGRRAMIGKRMLTSESGQLVRRCVFESPTHINVGEASRLNVSPPTIEGGCGRVCQSFFAWALGCSHNKVQQPQYATAYFHIEKPKTFAHTKSMKLGIARWLEHLAGYYQVDPTANLVLLPYKDRTSVYQLFEAEYHLAIQGNDFSW
jgi:hypothetical protein